MIIELTGSRILAPFLGTSLIVWTSLIGIILTSLSLGAWWGGIIADNQPRARTLARIVLLASWATAAIGLSKTWVLEFLQGAGNLHVIAILATMVLFAPASVLLGMVAPFAVRLGLEDPKHAGRTTGCLYAVSTIGSISGTFFAGFILIAWMGSTSILFATAAILVFASLMVESSGKVIKCVSLTVFGLAIFLCRQQDYWLEKQGFLDKDTQYNRVLVFTGKEEGTGRLTREMVTGPKGRQSAMYLDDTTELALPYTRFYRLVEHYRPTMKSMLVLGGGGFSFPKYALDHYPGVAIDVVELDAGITALARSHFELKDDPRLKIIEEDARTFLWSLQKNSTRYDVILCDVFTSHYSIPFHLVTVEAVNLMKTALTPGGVVLVNLLASPEGDSSRFYKTLYKTFSTAFSEIDVYAVFDPNDSQQWQNIILAAFNGPPPAMVEDVEMKKLLSHSITPPSSTIPPFTDEFAPVDRYLSSVSRFDY